jgi:hypothetical protein
MRKLATLLIAAGLVLGMAPKADAIDFKAKGNWMMDFEVGNNGKFTDTTGYNGKEDQFEAKQRVRLWLDAVASENLSGQVYFEIGKTTWGKAEGSGALGADDTCIKVRRAFIDWMIPETDVKVRMGIQGLGLPSYTMGKSQIFEDDVAGITVSANINENVGVTVFWARPYNDNYNGKYDTGKDANYMDNVDAFGLLIPLSFDGVKITPYGTIAAIGPNAFRNWTKGDGYWVKDNFGNTKGTSVAQMAYGLLPAWGIVGSNGQNVSQLKNDEYATAWWAGVTADITAADPFRIAFDFMGGGVSWDNSRMNRAGWLGALLLEYKTDFGIPGLVAWYASGDDDDLGNGSERMPYLSVSNGDNDFSNYAFDGGKYIAREGAIGSTMTGTWGVGLRIKDVSFVENLKHTLRVNYIGGTNDPGILKKLYRMGAAYQFPVNKANVGVENLYMTQGDSALEIGLSNEYKMYENFTIGLDASYIAMWMSDDKYGGIKKQMSGVSGKKHDVRDAWNVSVTFAYQF